MAKRKNINERRSPKKLSHYSTDASESTAKGIEAIIQKYIQHSTRIVKRGVMEWKKPEAYEKRRVLAVRRSLDGVIARHHMTEKTHGLMLTAELWCMLNTLPVHTLEECEECNSLFLGAALWIMDRVAGRRRWREILGAIDYEEDWLLTPFYDMSHSDEAVRMVAYVLDHRHQTEYTWLDVNPAPGKTAEALEQLLALIDPAQLRHAVATARGLFRQHEDAFFEIEYAFADSFNAAVDAYNAAVDAFNDAVDVTNEIEKEYDAWRRRPREKAPLPVAGSPVLTTPAMTPEVFAGMMDASPAQFLLEPKALDSMNPFDRMREQLDRLSALGTDAFEKENAIHDIRGKMITCAYDFMAYGLTCVRDFIERNPQIEGHIPRIDIPDPYEACMGILLLCTPSALERLYADVNGANVERDADLPWQMGTMCALSTTLSDTLPWVMEAPDDFELAEKKVTKSLTHPNWYAMDYEEDGMPLNLAQILFRETAAILPRDMGKFDHAHKALWNLGIRGKTEAHLTEMMTLMSAVQYHFDAFTHASELFDPEPPEDVEALKAQVKDLREKLKAVTDEAHAQDRRARKAEQALSQEREKIQMDRQELASLRELVFIRENGDASDESVSVALPYAVQQRLVVYGGHDTWLRAMREYLSGDIRFIDKDQAAIDRSVIRNADAVWIQTNAISHRQYYAIIDEVRKVGVPVRYFLYASARKCAEQVALYEQEP